MKKILQLEEAMLLAFCLYVFPRFELSWWWFAGLILTPDIGMLGYLINSRIGAFTYNFFHHRGVAVVVGAAGVLTGELILQVAGYTIFTHSCLDRMLGYGLKYEKGFGYTHLGTLTDAIKKHQG